MKVSLASAVYAGFPPETLLSLARTVSVLADKGLLYDVADPLIVHERDANTMRARNLLLHECLKRSKADVFLYFDADTVWNPQHVLSLLRHEEDIVCPIVARRPMRPDIGDLGNVTHVGYQIQPEERRGSLLAMRRIGWGMFLAQRESLLRMQRNLIERGRTLRMRPNERYEGEVIARFVDTFATEKEGHLLSTDDVFSDRALAAGLKLWLDTEVHVGHLGQHVFV